MVRYPDSRHPFAGLRIGYACVNSSVGCTSSSAMRLRSFTLERALAVSRSNLACLRNVLEWNAEHGIVFFRMSSDLIPLASHPSLDWPWREELASELREMGRAARRLGARLCMHPDQFVVLNSPRKEVVASSVAELAYHCDLLDAMGFPGSTKVQVHLGGAYGNKPEAIRRFVASAGALDESILKRLVVENDDRLFTLADCLAVNRETGLPVVLDFFHHSLNNCGEDAGSALESASATWRGSDGPQVTDYSDPQPGGRRGAHSQTLDEDAFASFLPVLANRRIDLMLEVKDKEQSALKAMRAVDAKEMVRAIAARAKSADAGDEARPDIRGRAAGRGARVRTVGRKR